MLSFSIFLVNFFLFGSLENTTSYLRNIDYAPSFPSLTTTKHAYAFLIAGCESSNPSYMGLLHNIIVAAHILRRSGSTSDIVILVRMATTSTETSLLLDTDVEEVLQKYGIILKYLEKAKVDNFYTAMLDKFAILDLKEYTRVLFMDADVMPLCNLDYMFKLSEGKNAVLRENIVLAYRHEPASGGFFILKPNHTDYLSMVQIQSERLKQGYHFDTLNGWGHTIQPPDEWVTLYGERGTNWTFYGALADQGLLYYWTKYFKKSLSIINRNKVETWSSSDSDINMVQKIREEHDIIGHGCASTLPSTYQRPSSHDEGYGIPYADFVHFTGKAKPWVRKQQSAASDFWFSILREVVKENNMLLDVENFKIGFPSLGSFPAHIMAHQAMEAEVAASEVTRNEGLNNDTDNQKETKEKFIVSPHNRLTYGRLLPVGPPHAYRKIRRGKKVKKKKNGLMLTYGG